MYAVAVARVRVLLSIGNIRNLASLFQNACPDDSQINNPQHGQML